MAVEIYQLNINVNVKDDKKKKGEGGGGGGANASMNKKEIIDACVDSVMEIINQKEMR